jgi:hypothetical protein
VGTTLKVNRWASIIKRVGKKKSLRAFCCCSRCSFTVLGPLMYRESMPIQLKTLNNAVLISCREEKEEIILVKEDQL